MVEIFRTQLESASPEMKIVLNGLIEKWGGWHASTFHFLHMNGYGGLRISNWNELHKMCVLV